MEEEYIDISLNEIKSMALAHANKEWSEVEFSEEHKEKGVFVSIDELIEYSSCDFIKGFESAVNILKSGS